MKRRILSIALALALLLTLLPGVAPHAHAEGCEHDYTNAGYESDDEGHWQKCTKCGASSGKAAHSYDTVLNFIDQELPHRHRMKCGICERQADWGDCADGDGDGLCDTCGNNVACAHDYENAGYEVNGAAGHYQNCKVIGCTQTSDTEPHVDTDGSRECDYCYYRMPCEHDYTGAEYHSDSEGHWQYCTKDCATSSGTEPHADTNDDGQCDTCNYVTCTHDNMTYDYDAEYHFLHCAVCGETGEEAPHVYNVVETMFPHEHWMKCGTCGRTADEWGVCADSDGDGYCDDCGQCVGEHEFEVGYYHVDEDYHSPECDNCPYYNTGRKATHADTDADHFCDVCGYEMSVCADEAPRDHKCDLCGGPIPVVDDDGDGKCDDCGKTAPTLTAEYTELTYFESEVAIWVSGTLKVTSDVPGTVTAVWGDDDNQVKVTAEVSANVPASLKFEDVMWYFMDRCTLTFEPDDQTAALPVETSCDIEDSAIHVAVIAQTDYLDADTGHFVASFTINGANNGSLYLVPGSTVTVKLDLQPGDSYEFGKWTVDEDTGMEVFAPSDTGYIYYIVDEVEKSNAVTGNTNGTITFKVPEASDSTVNLHIRMKHDTGECKDTNGDHWCDSSICVKEFPYTDADGYGICDICGAGGVRAENGEIFCGLAEALELGGTVKLLANHTETWEDVYTMAVLDAEVEVTLDLNGFILSVEGADYLFDVYEDNTLKIIDTSASKTGAMTNPNGSGIISLYGGVVDLSEYPDLEGLTVYNDTDAPVAVSGHTVDATPIKLLLPEGYVVEHELSSGSTLIPAGYTATVVRAVRVKDGKLIVSNAPDGMIVVIAAYEDGKMTDCQYVTYTGPVDIKIEGSDLRAFFLDGATKAPLFGSLPIP